MIISTGISFGIQGNHSRDFKILLLIYPALVLIEQSISIDWINIYLIPVEQQKETITVSALTYV
jgi:hypothetical protein